METGQAESFFNSAVPSRRLFNHCSINTRGTVQLLPTPSSNIFKRNFPLPMTVMPWNIISMDYLILNASAPEEVIRAVGALKPNKTTGISRLSVLQHLVQAEFGLHLLCTMLNAFLTDLTMLPTCLATGWVILVPKKAFVHAPDQFRPVVCGEVMLKLLAKLAMTRIACQWPVPNCCFGACPGRGVAEALYTVKVCAQKAAGLQDDTIFLQLDISSAFDSLQLRAILQFFREKWSPNIAKSCRLLQWVLSHSVLRFQLFDSTWSLRQLVGTQQGASHSPILFGRIIAAKFDALCTLREQHLESPAFRVGAESLWGLWFVDDAICFFRNKAQFARLVPQLISMLADLGLTVNIAKSCSLSCSGPPRSLLCLRDLPHVVTSKYLGLQLRLAEGDDHMLQGFLRRTSCAFFSNRLLLTAREATRPARLRMFQSLVTSSILWSLAALSAHAVHLRALRVHHVTLLGWMLQCSPHFSWRDPTCCQTLGTMLFHLMGPASPRTAVEMGGPCVAHAAHLLFPQCPLESVSLKSGRWKSAGPYGPQQLWASTLVTLAWAQWH